MSTSRRSTSSRGPAQASGGTRRPRVAGLRNRSQQDTVTEAPTDPQAEEAEVASTELAESGHDAAQYEGGAQPEAPGVPPDDSARHDDVRSGAPEVLSEDEDPVTVTAHDDSDDDDSDDDGSDHDGSDHDEHGTSRDEATVADGGEDADETGSGDRRRLITKLTRRPVALIAAMLVCTAAFGGLAFWFHSEAYSLRYEGAAANRALVDQAATSQVKGQITEAVETLFSYDYANTAKTEQAAKKLLTGKAVTQYDKLFETVKKQAPKQKLVLTTTVRAAGVTQLQDDRAEVLLFVDQNATRTDTGQSNIGPAQLTVSAEKHGDQWKISRITPR